MIPDISIIQAEWDVGSIIKEGMENGAGVNYNRENCGNVFDFSGWSGCFSLEDY